MDFAASKTYTWEVNMSFPFSRVYEYYVDIN